MSFLESFKNVTNYYNKNVIDRILRKFDILLVAQALKYVQNVKLKKLLGKKFRI